MDGASRIQRFTLPSLIPDLEIPLGTDPNLGPYYALDIQVAPSNSRTIAVSLGCKNLVSPAVGGVVIFDDAVPRAVKAKAPQWHFNTLQWGLGTDRLYAANCDSSSWNYYILSVDSSGVTLFKDMPNSFSSWINAIHFDPSASKIYADSGQVLVAADGTNAGLFMFGEFSDQSRARMTINPGGNRAFFLVLEHPLLEFHLKSFDLAQFTKIATI